MPRPRFITLAPARRRAILAAAAEEVAAAGAEGASFNRIIARAGASKGAMYYYFDDKADLLRTVVGDALARAGAEIGPPRPCGDALEFWVEVSRLIGRALELLAREPVLAGLVRRVLAAPDGPLADAAAPVRAEVAAATTGLLRAGQAVGAVRDDLPPELLVGLATGVGEAMDRWLFARWEHMTAAELAAVPARAIDLLARLVTPDAPARAARRKR